MYFTEHYIQGLLSSYHTYVNEALFLYTATGSCCNTYNWEQEMFTWGLKFCQPIAYCQPYPPMLSAPSVVNGVTHFPWKREVAMFILTRFDSKRDSALTSFDGNVHLVISCIENKVGQNCQRHPRVESWGSERAPSHSKPLSQGVSRRGWIQT